MKLFTPNLDFFDNYFDKSRYLIAWRIALIFTIVFAILVPLFGSVSFIATIPTLVSFLISLGSLIYLKKTKNYLLLFWVFSICGSIILHLTINLVMTFPHYVDFLWIIATILVAFIGLGRKFGFWFILIHSVAIFYFYAFTLNKHITILQERTPVELFGDYLEILLALFSIAYLLIQYLKMNDYSEQKLKKTNQELIEKNAENTVLMKEVHHRVKNNLQIITSLLRLQKNDLPENTKTKFDEAINRIMTMSIIHKKLYQTEELSKIDLQSYINDLINEITSSLSTNIDVETNIKSTIESIGLKTVVPLGLLINELLSNSFKHAFYQDRVNIIDVNITTKNNSDLVLSYSDNGIWKEAEKSSSQFGTELIQILTDQLEGSFTRENSNYNFTLKNLDN
jgi:two-component sensor histidine kinase